MCFPLTLLFAFLGLLAEKEHMARWGFFRSLPLPLLSLSSLITPISHSASLLIVSVSCQTGRPRQGEPLCVFSAHHLSGGLVGGLQFLWAEWCSSMGQGGEQAEVLETRTVTSVAMASAKDGGSMRMVTYYSETTSLHVDQRSQGGARDGF